MTATAIRAKLTTLADGVSMATPSPMARVLWHHNGDAEKVIAYLGFNDPAVAGDRIVLVGRLSIPTVEGVLIREATGQEKLECGSYGDPSSNAESMSFRRCCAKFGLGLHLYRKENPSSPTRERSSKEVSREEWLSRRAQQPSLRPRPQPATADGCSID